MPMGPVALHPLVAAARAAGVRDRRVLEALAAVPRARYVRPSDRDVVDRDIPLPIGGDQVTTQPSLLAMMVAALALEGDERVLEVGAGLGYQSAVLGRLAREVWSVERRPELAAAAMANLEAEGVGNVQIVTGDGSQGLTAHAPYGAIVVAAAHPSVPPPLAAQLAPGGRLVQPIGLGGSEEVTLFVGAPGERLIRERVIALARFVALYGRYGFAPGTEDAAADGE
jgi:protein-L-isoaspartate(D-aspartate) O-methyltransferase